MNSRIVLIRKDAKLSQTEFAKALNLSRTFVSLVETGDRQISDRTIADICRTFNVNETWLKTGNGEMHDPKSREAEIAEYALQLQKEENGSFKYKVAMYLKDMPEEDWEAFHRFVKAIAAEEAE